jgi:hypothetical protein
MNQQAHIDGAPRVRRLWRWFSRDFMGIFLELRWRYVPPLMIYFAAGVSSFTGIIESFYVKEQLGLSAAFLASLGFWAGLPWALKMPVGHLVDLFWRYKAGFVYAGALLMAGSLLIMVGLTGNPEAMARWLKVETWYIVSVILAPVGYVLQDVVADAMTVEAVPAFFDDGSAIPEPDVQKMHITMQTLGRIAIVGGSAIVAGAGGWLAKVLSYQAMYEIALVIPAISVSGVLLSIWMQRKRRRRLNREGLTREEIERITRVQGEKATPDFKILGGSGAFVAVSLLVGTSAIPLKEEIIFLGSLAAIIFIMVQLLRPMTPAKRREIVGIAIIIFVYRSMPTFGPGSSWWQIDVLGFDEAFFGTLRQISALIVIIGMMGLRAWMARRPVPYLVVFISIYSTAMLLPFIGMYYGLHEWTQAHLGFGARTIAIVDTMADSPMGQVVMIPMLAWIAREAPSEQKATYFAVMAAFTNLALSASQLATQYVNEVFEVQRGDYGELGMLMICVAMIGLVVPIAAVWIFNPARARRSAGTLERSLSQPKRT